MGNHILRLFYWLWLKFPGRWRVIVILLAILAPGRLQAVEENGTFSSSEPTSSSVSKWNTGWGSSDETGWDYVGTVGGASGVYLGNGWVLTAGHVGTGDFTLDGITYDYVVGSEESLSDSYGTADLTLFQISTEPDLPSLNLDYSSTTLLGSSVVMIGYGGGSGETWGDNTVTSKNLLVTPTGYSYVSIDFETAFGGENSAELVSGDSGGADFVYLNGQWELAGINEAVDSSGDSYMVELSAYVSEINGIVAAPEPPGLLLVALGLVATGIVRHGFVSYRSPVRSKLPPIPRLESVLQKMTEFYTIGRNGLVIGMVAASVTGCVTGNDGTKHFDPMTAVHRTDKSIDNLLDRLDEAHPGDDNSGQ